MPRGGSDTVKCAVKVMGESPLLRYSVQRRLWMSELRRCDLETMNSDKHAMNHHKYGVRILVLTFSFNLFVSHVLTSF